MPDWEACVVDVRKFRLDIFDPKMAALRGGLEATGSEGGGGAALSLFSYYVSGLPSSVLPAAYGDYPLRWIDPSARSMPGQRRRRWPGIDLALNNPVTATGPSPHLRMTMAGSQGEVTRRSFILRNADWTMPI